MKPVSFYDIGKKIYKKNGEELPRRRWTWVFQPARIIIVKLIKPEQQSFL